MNINKAQSWQKTYVILSNISLVLLVVALGYFMFAKFTNSNLALPGAMFCFALGLSVPVNLLKELKSGYISMPIVFPWPFAKRKNQFPKPIFPLKWIYKHDSLTGTYYLRPPFNYEIKAVSNKVHPILFSCLIALEVLVGVFFITIGIYVYCNQELINI